jgi:hypothetical protein
MLHYALCPYGHSDSDYEATRTEILNKRARRRSRGKVVSDTSESDGQAEEEMMKDVTDESQLQGRKSACKHKKRLTAKQKGKQKADSVVSGGEEVGDDGDDCQDPENTGDEDDAEGIRRCVPGPLSHEALEEIGKLRERTMADVEALACKYGKSTRRIMISAGFAVQHSRNTENFSNKFKVWYAHKHPKPADSTLHPITGISTSLLNDLHSVFSKLCFVFAQQVSIVSRKIPEVQFKGL